MAAMVKHLASLAGDRLILSFAPSTPALLVLKRIGEFFPKGSKVRCSGPPLRMLLQCTGHALTPRFACPDDMLCSALHPHTCLRYCCAAASQRSP